MQEKKQVQIIIRTTPEEKEKITNKAKENGISVNEFIKKTMLEKIENQNNSDNKNDNMNDIIKILHEQLANKDEQIINLQKIIYNRDTKLIELEKENSKHWWEFWK
jgi:uncharacterized protein (DUF1778 family)